MLVITLALVFPDIYMPILSPSPLDPLLIMTLPLENPGSTPVLTYSWITRLAHAFTQVVFSGRSKLKDLYTADEAYSGNNEVLI